MYNKKSIFVKVDDYKGILETMEQIKEKVARAKEALAKIEELKAKEDAELGKWKERIDFIESKMITIDNNFSNPDMGD